MSCHLQYLSEARLLNGLASTISQSSLTELSHVHRKVTCTEYNSFLFYSLYFFYSQSHLFKRYNQSIDLDNVNTGGQTSM